MDCFIVPLAEIVLVFSSVDKTARVAHPYRSYI